MSKQSSLTSIIVDLGFSAEQQVGEVQARQVIYGGDQETNLLELALVNEEELLEALAKMTGLPPSPSGYLVIDAALTERLPASASTCVAGYDDGDLPVVFTSDKPSETLLADLEEVLGDGVQLFAAPQLRISEALACLDKGKLTVRQNGVLEKIGPRPLDAPLGAAVEIPEDAPTAAPPEVAPAPEPTTAPQAIVPPPRSSETPEVQEAPLRPLGSARAALEDNPPAAPVIETAPPPEGYAEIASSSSEIPAGKAARPAPRHSYSIAEASKDLQGAKNRDRAIDVLVHYAAQFFEYTAVFAVLSKEAKGLTATGKGAPTDEVKKLRIPLDLPSVFKEAKTSTAPKVAKLKASGLEGGIARDLDRPTGRDIFLLPIGVRSRAVLLLWGDRGTTGVTLDSVAELISFAPIVSQTLERVLIEHKRASRVARPADAASLNPPRSVETTDKSPGAPAPLPEGAQMTRPIVSAHAPQTRAPQTKRNPAAPAAQAPNVGTVSTDAPPSGAEPDTAEPDTAEPDTSGSEVAVPEAPVPENSAPAEDGHQGVRAHKRTLNQPRTPEERRSDPPGFAEPPKTLRGFPEVRSPSQEFESPAPVQSLKKPSARAPLLSRRIVPLGDIAHVDDAHVDDAPPPPAPEAPAEAIVPESPIVEVRDLNDDDDDQPTHSSRGTMMSRRPQISEPAESGWESPAAPAVQEVKSEATVSPGGTSCTDLVQALIDGDESTIDRLVDSGDTAVGALIAQFPGPVEEPKDATMKASACGPVLKALAALGSRTTPFLTVRTADSDASVRRWATFLLGELTGKDAARAIAGRLLDDSIDVRRAALNSARRARSDVITRRTLRSQVEEMCRDKSLGIESRCAAVEALADIREHEAIPTLLQLLEDKDASLVRATRWALSVLTRQDFGNNNGAWRDFWQAHRDEDRIEWLISSLDHEQRDLRRAAGEELKSIVGDDFGYSEDLSEDERKNAQTAFRNWWEQQGKTAPT